MKIGPVLKELRLEKELTQQQVASRLKISRNAYMAWENDQVILTVGKLNKLCRIFGVNIREFFDPDQPEKPPEKPSLDPGIFSDFIEEKLRFLRAHNSKIMRLNKKLGKMIAEMYSEGYLVDLGAKDC